ncbi:MAG TPA: mechanosensitive ion channel family protein [Chloroflexota bacterium]|nr:mechanosensitive ion channel family protein [Chloroflexota bacterium]
MIRDLLARLLGVPPTEESATLAGTLGVVGTFLNIVIILGLALLTWFAIRRVIRSRLIAAHVVADGRHPRNRSRALTLRRLFEDIARYTLVIYAGYLILREVGLDLTPVLASVGILGLAFSLGAQSLVRDILTGLFLLFEDQLHVGDFVEVVGVAGASGIVEEFGLRATRIRNIQGELHFIPNGQIGAINRYTHGYVTYFVDLRLPSGVERAEAVKIVEETAGEVCRQVDVFVRPPVVAAKSITPPGIVRLSAEIVPLTQWVVEQELAPRCRAAMGGLTEAEVPPPTVFRLPEEVVTYRRNLLGFSPTDPETSPITSSSLASRVGPMPDHRPQ